MPPLVLLASLTRPTLAALGAVVLVAGYALLCTVWPWRRCPACRGLGRLRAHLGLGRTWRPCRRCHGTGRRLRHGRRLYNHLRMLHQEADR